MESTSTATPRAYNTAAYPTQMGVKDIPMYRLEKATLQQMKKGKTYAYIIDSEDHLHLTDEPLDLSKDTFWLVKNSRAKNNIAMAVKQAGKFEFKPGKGETHLLPLYESALSIPETDAILAQLKREHSTVNFKMQHTPTQKSSRLLTCMEILAAQRAGKGFVLTSLLGTNIAITGRFLYSEYIAKDNETLTSEERRKVFAADLVGSNLGAGIMAGMGKAINLSQMGTIPAFALSAALGYVVWIEGQDAIYKEMLGQESENDSDRFTHINRMMFLARIPFNLAFDKAIMDTIPMNLFNACSKGAKITATVAPYMTRLAERAGNTTVYYIFTH